MKQKSEGFQPVGNAILSLRTLEPSTCSRLEHMLSKVPGIVEVNLNHAADVVQVKFDPTKVTGEGIRTIMKKLGNATSH